MATFNRINKLRFFQLLGTHFGDQDAKEFADALQDELSPLATKADLDTLRDSIRADITVAVNSMLFKFTAMWAALLAAAVLLLRLT
jgi:small basic protein